MASGLAWLGRRDAVSWGCIVLATLYASRYLSHAALPGNNAEFPIGWWGWWDQSKFLASATALARGDLNPALHHYPLGYSLLGAPFARVMPVHPFFFVDLAALLVSLIAFVAFARRCGVARRRGTLLFVLASAADPVLFQQWVVPWNTTPLAAAIWVLLALSAAHLDGQRRAGWLGLAVVVITMLRPSDVVLALPPLAVCLLADIRHRRWRWLDLVWFGLAVLVPAGLYLGLHAAIYGWQPSPYMRVAKEIGFTPHRLGWKAYVILVDPTPWIGGGEGLLRRCPWLILGAAGLISAARSPRTAMLGLTLALHSVIYLCFIDLLPTGFWRYLNVHYWTWSFPGFALLGVLLVRDLLALDPPSGRSGRPLAAVGLAAVALLLCIRLDPAPAGPGQSIDAVDIDRAPTGFDAIYFAQFQLTDAEGALTNMRQVRGIPLPDTIRILALTRALHEPIGLAGDGLDGLAPIALRTRLGFGLPVWPWRAPGEFYGPR